MAAPKRNQYWKLRSKHGRDRIIQDPEILNKAADEYFQWCIDNPIIEIDYRGKDLVKVELPHPQVFQKGGLARWCGLADWRGIEDLKRVSKDFLKVVTRIEGIIRDQKFKYASVNMFNSNIVARDLGLSDKIKNENTNLNANIEDAEERRRLIEKILKKTK